jgi:hypothetical protein
LDAGGELLGRIEMTVIDRGQRGLTMRVERWGRVLFWVRVLMIPVALAVMIGLAVLRSW